MFAQCKTSVRRDLIEGAVFAGQHSARQRIISVEAHIECFEGGKSSTSARRLNGL